MSGAIVIRGARQHNLQNIDVEFPRDRIVVITGPSGSGKSSLAFDTLVAEGQRRYVETLSTQARRMLDALPRPDVDAIEGLTPTISIAQMQSAAHPRSTVGTASEVHDYLRLLFARVGEPHCPRCGDPLSALTVQQIVDRVLGWELGTGVSVRAPIARDKRGALRDELAALARQGFVRVVVDGAVHELDSDIDLDARRTHTLDVDIDRVRVKPEVRQRLTESVELGLSVGRGVVALHPLEGEPWLASDRNACPRCGIGLGRLTSATFSFNTPAGACPQCQGLGETSPAQEDSEHEGEARADEQASAPAVGEPCAACGGSRLSEAARSVRLAGETIDQLCRRTLDELVTWLHALELPATRAEIAQRIIVDLQRRLAALHELGVGYLAPSRSTTTLSGGELGRVRLASHIGTGLSGVTYVLDEPSAGLHVRDTARLMSTLRRLRDLGNTVVLVEHDLAMIAAGDWVVDLGPGAGAHGGQLLAVGTPDDIARNPKSVTGPYLGRRERAKAITARRGDAAIILKGAHAHNLQAIDVRIPVGALTCVTGVSGSGKSSLVLHTLLPAARAVVRGAAVEGPLKSARGLGRFTRVVHVDQRPIGRTPRSNPATYTGLFTTVRELFATLPDARARGYGAKRFSFNLKGGRCEACQGVGAIRVEMHFLPDAYVRCDACEGRRYNRETLEIRYRGLDIGRVLDLRVEEAREVFAVVERIAAPLSSLCSVGLGYLPLGQGATTLSAGEAQRLRLATELARKASGETLYVLDEPTSGLHALDVEVVLGVLESLVAQGHTVVVIEHDLAVIERAAHVVDIGPEGGPAGGRLMATGPPDAIAATDGSHTGEALRERFAGR